MSLHPSTRTKLVKLYGEQYKTAPDEVRKALIETEGLEPEQVKELTDHLDVLESNKGIPADTNIPGPTIAEAPGTYHMGMPNTAPPPAVVDGPYKSWDIYKGQFQMIDGTKIFSRIGKAVKTNARMTDDEVIHFNESRGGVELNTVVEQIVPSGK